MDEVEIDYITTVMISHKEIFHERERRKFRTKQETFIDKDKLQEKRLFARERFKWLRNTRKSLKSGSDSDAHLSCRFFFLEVMSRVTEYKAC
jgi:hypothetical protein